MCLCYAFLLPGRHNLDILRRRVLADQPVACRWVVVVVYGRLVVNRTVADGPAVAGFPSNVR
jgi:hypothetical protein